MIGAIIFVICFLAFFGITLGMPTLPPGHMIFGLLNIPAEIDYSVLGIPAEIFITAIVNGVVYGFVIWLVFSIINAATGHNKKNQNVSQTVNIEVGDKAPPQGGTAPPPPPPAG